MVGDGWPWWGRVAVGFAVFVGVVFIELARMLMGRRRLRTDDQEQPDARQPAQRPEVAEPFPGKVTFSGRRQELAELRRRHSEEIAKRLHQAAGIRKRRLFRRSGGMSGQLTRGQPLLLFVHGKAGIGKSALAQELARQLKPDYRHGLLYANLGNAGDPLSAGEILKRFLDDLGWHGPMPGRHDDRAKLFRKLTAGKRYLFILDAARTYQQVVDVLPSDSGCTVIVTSRRDIGSGAGIPSVEVGLLSSDDAIDMLYAVAGTKPLVSVECATKIVGHCGLLPLAIQSAGERISLEGSSVCDVALALRPESSRNFWLSRQGIKVDEGFETEYELLDDREQEAFRLLAHVDSDTFLPWVLCPMLGISLDDAADLCGRLNRAQLVDIVALDPVNHLVRYKMHPLVCLYARHRTLADGHRPAVERACGRLEDHFRILSGRVMDLNGGGGVSAGAPSDVPAPVEELARALAYGVDGWTSLEYVNLTRAVSASFSWGHLDLCWRVGQSLAGLVPVIDSAVSVRRTFGAAITAAGQVVDPFASIDVRLAHAASLTALERYAEAHGTLDEARRRTVELADDGRVPQEALRYRVGMMHLRTGEAYVQMRRPAEAAGELQRAAVAFQDVSAHEEARLVRILEALNVDFNYEDPYDAAIEELSTPYRFWAILERYEERRRQQAWSDAEAELDKAARYAVGDTRKRANLLYRRAKLHLMHWESLVVDPSEPSADPDTQELAKKSGYRAAEAMWAFERMGNVVGEIRSACLLSRALVAAGLVGEARQQIRFADSKLERLPTVCRQADEPLRGRLLFASSIALRAASRTGEAHLSLGEQELLLQAADIFRKLDDGRSRQAVAKVLALSDKPVR